jgi:predicted transposase YdaD
VESSYDATFKVLVDRSPGAWAEFVFGSSIGLASPVDTSLHATKEVVDRLLRVESLGREFIIHIEFHAGHSGNAIPNRLFYYNTAVMKRYSLTTLSCVLILRREADSPAVNASVVHSLPEFGDVHRFRYRPIRIWKEPLERFLIPGSSLAVAGVLADFGERTLEEAGAEIRRCIDLVRDPDQRKDLHYHFVVLAGMRFNRSQAESIFGGNMSMLEKYSVTLQYFIREGEERGQRSLLLASARQVFGTPTQQVIEKINEATSEKLLAWNTRLRTAQSWSELITD